MLIRKRIFSTAVLFLICITSLGQNLSNRGKEFYVGFGHHQFFENNSNLFDMVLYLSAEEAATVTVSIPGIGYSQNYNVPANSVIVTDPIPRTGTFDARLYNPSNNSEGIFNKGIKISSNVPIVAYSHIYGSASSGATMLMPTDTWGYAYQSVNSKQEYATNCFSWFYVIAKENNTVIEITPSVPTRGGKPANVPFTVTLNQGQIYQVLGALSSGSNGHEMTGTRVRSIANSAGVCHPIAAFSGSSRTSNPLNACSTTSSGDNDMQQLFPSQAWGKKYLLAPTSTSTNAGAYQTNAYKIVVQDPNTVVKRGPVTLPQSSLINNTYYYFESGSAQMITADKPVMVAQFMSGSACMGGGTNVGDPEMIIVSPIEQGIKRIGFYKNHRQSITTVYLTLIIPQNGLSSLTIDGESYPSGFTHSFAHPSAPGYWIVIKRWAPALSNAGQSIVQSDSAFTAITYGMGSVESYGYNAGTLINNLNVIGTLFNTPDSTSSATSHPFTCINTPVEISMSVAYPPTSMTWQLSQVPNLSPNADVTINNPMPHSTTQVNGITYYNYSLPGTYLFSDTGSFVIPVRNVHPSIENCNNSEVVNFALIVKPKPKIDFSYVHTGCVRDSVQFNSNAVTENGYQINSWKWNFEDATTASVQNPKKLFSTPGDQSVNMQVVTEQGCLGDTSKTITLHPPPAATFGSSQTAFCEGNSVNFTDTSSYGGPGSLSAWYWDFGNGQTVNASNNNPQSTTYPAYGNYTVKHVVKVSEFCISDTATKVITVFAKPTTTFDFPVGCLPSSGLIEFTNTSSAPDGQAINHSWNFGDPNADANNPNTSTLQSPSHYYNLGTYTINYTATTENGCSKDTSVTTTFNVSPDVTYGALAAVCENQTSFSVASAQVTNNVTGTGIYKGPGVNAAGQFSPSAAGPGLHTLWYVFTSGGGCKDSASTTIQVYPQPVINFNFPAGCLASDGLIEFTNTTTDPDGNPLTHAWNFGDPNATASNPNTSNLQSPSHYYSLGTYTINYSATTTNGCVKDSTFTTTFNVSPEVTYGPLTDVCQSQQGTVSIASGQVTNNVTGTGIYKGPGVNAQGAFSPSVAGPGDHTIWFVFTSNGGCKDSASTSIKVHPKPVVSNVSAVNVCLNELTTLSSTSTISEGNIIGWNWNFGDGNTASYTNDNPFTRNYTSAGTYTIKLVTVSGNGCVSDTATGSVTIHPKPAPNFTMPAFICMPNGNAVFTNTSQIASGSMNYSWDFGDGSPASTANNPSHIYTTSTPKTVRLTATSGFGCIADTSKILDVFYDKPVANFQVQPETLCQGTNNVFTDQSFAPNSTVQSHSWTFGDGTTSILANPTKQYSQAGVYTVTLTVKNEVGCTSDPFKDTVIVYVQPVIDAGPSFIVPEGTLVTFKPVVNDSVNIAFLWTPSGDFADPTVLRPSITATHNQTYVLTATGDGDCTATDTMSVRILKPITVPNSFSPNGDGINDVWLIPNLADYQNCKVEVFNRYGQLVFQSNGYGKPWDGTYKNNPVPFATYYYIITLNHGYQPVTGSVTIVR